jgi:hypothetical protein
MYSYKNKINLDNIHYDFTYNDPNSFSIFEIKD